MLDGGEADPGQMGQKEAMIKAEPEILIGLMACAFECRIDAVIVLSKDTGVKLMALLIRQQRVAYKHRPLAAVLSEWPLISGGVDSWPDPPATRLLRGKDHLKPQAKPVPMPDGLPLADHAPEPCR